MKANLKHLLCLALAASLLLAGQACKKMQTTDFRDQYVGRYACVQHHSRLEGNIYTDTILGPDTIQVNKAAQDSAMEVKGTIYTFYNYGSEYCWVIPSTRLYDNRALIFTDSSIYCLIIGQHHSVFHEDRIYDDGHKIQ